MKKILLISLLLIITTGCSEFALLASGSSLAISQNTYAKMYNSVDFLTVISTEKSIKGHAYNNMKKIVHEQTLKNIELKRQKLLKEGKKYIYDKTWGLTHN